jgi:hypothetical protein
MAITISNSYIETFENTVRQLSQQKQSLLRKAVMETSKQSTSHNWERLTLSAARSKTSARMVSPAGGNGSGAVGSTDGLAWSRRKTNIQTFDTGEVVEQEDIVQMLVDPKSASTENLVMNMNRAVDDIIIEAALGDATNGDGTDTALPAGQIIGDYSTEIDLDLVLAVQENFDSNDVDPDIPRYFVIGPKQKRKLFQLIEVVSGDYQDKKALATGYMPNFLGFNWVVSNRLNVPAADQLDCFAMTGKALGLHVAGDISTRVAERPDMSFAWQVYLQMSMDAVRVEDDMVVHCKLSDTVA